MRDQILNRVEIVLSVFGIGLGIAQIEQILGIILLSFQVLLILFRIGARIYQHIKKGDVQSAIEEGKVGEEEIRKVIEGSKHGKEK